jgi:hypothetical protein
MGAGYGRRERRAWRSPIPLFAHVQRRDGENLLRARGERVLRDGAEPLWGPELIAAAEDWPR